MYLLRTENAFKYHILPSGYLHFISLFSNHFLNAYYVPSIVLDTRDVIGFLMELTIKQGDTLINN